MLEHLTDREEEVLQAISEGLTDDQIGTKLHLTRGTVKAHTRSIRKKLRVHERASAVRIAIELDIIHGPDTIYDFTQLEADELLLCKLVVEGKTDDALSRYFTLHKRFIQTQLSALCAKVGVQGRYHLTATYTKWRKANEKKK